VGSIGGGLSALATLRTEGTLNAIEYSTRAARIHQQTMIDDFFHPWTSMFQWISDELHVATTQMYASFHKMTGVSAGSAAAAHLTGTSGGAPTVNLTVPVTIAN